MKESLSLVELEKRQMEYDEMIQSLVRKDRWTLVDSEAFVAYEYRPTCLYILFKNGAIYEYENVTRADLDAMLSATSIGTYFNTVFKKCFTAEKVG